MLLFARGADLDLANKEGQTPLGLAGPVRSQLLEAAGREPEGKD